MVKNPNLTRFSLVQCGQVSVIVIAMNNSTTTHYPFPNFPVNPANASTPTPFRPYYTSLGHQIMTGSFALFLIIVLFLAISQLVSIKSNSIETATRPAICNQLDLELDSHLHPKLPHFANQSEIRAFNSEQERLASETMQHWLQNGCKQ